MKMITRCPACSTLFKVVPDQLRIADGWVRCGQCMAIFDAQAHMLPADSDTPSDLRGRETGTGPSDPTGSADIAPPIADDKDVADTEPMTSVFEPILPDTKHPASGEVVSETVPRAETEDPSGDLSDAWKSAQDPPTPAGVPEAPAGLVSDAVVAPASAMLTHEELDRWHAHLMETLARLRRHTEKSKGGSKGAEAGSLVSHASGGASNASPDDSPDRDALARDMSANQDPAKRQRGRENKSQEQERNRGSAREKPRNKTHTQNLKKEQQVEDERGGRFIIDFVLSEIGDRPLPPDPSRSSRSRSRKKEKELKATSAPPKKDDDAPSFVEQARRRAFWVLPHVRAALWSMAALMAALLAAQIAASQRDRLAAQFPGTAPLFAALCRPMHCQIAPWRHLDAVAIDSSSFVRAGPDSFDVAVTLRNGGGAPVATPALELTLTDAQEQPLARRVLVPADWGAPPQLAAHGEFSGVALLTVQDAAHPQAISGYRLAAFYP